MREITNFFESFFEISWIFFGLGRIQPNAFWSGSVLSDPVNSEE